MDLLIVWATYSSGTDLATELVEKTLLTLGKRVKRIEIRSAVKDDFVNAKNVLFATPSFRTRKGDGMPHEFFLDYMDGYKDGYLNSKNCVVLGLGDSSYTHFCGGVDEMEKFIKNSNGNLITESLRIEGFYFDPKNNEQKIIEWTNKLSLLL